MRLTGAQQERYARHLLLDGLGGEGQERLLAACVRIRGTGRAARWAARYLAASGIGTLLLDDRSIASECRDLSPDLKTSDRESDLVLDLSEKRNAERAEIAERAEDLVDGARSGAGARSQERKGVSAISASSARSALGSEEAFCIDSEAVRGTLAALRTLRRLSRP